MASSLNDRTILEHAVILLVAANDEGFLPEAVSEEWFIDATSHAAWRILAQGRNTGERVDYGTLLGALGPRFAEIMEHQEMILASNSALETTVHALRQYVLRDHVNRWIREIVPRLEDPESAVAWLAQSAQEALADHRPVHGHTGHEMAMEHFMAVDERNLPVSQRPKPILFGVDSLDAIVQGISPAEVVAIGGRPKKGKSQFALNLTQHWLGEGRSVVYFSFEMIAIEIASRLMALHGRLPLKMVEKHPITGDAMSLYVKAQGWLSATSLTVYDEPMNWATIAAAIRHHHLKGEADMVVLDHLGLITRDPRPGENTNDTLGKIVRGIKNLAQELRIPIVVVSQLSRAVESRQDKRPQAYDFRDTGEIEQSANLLLTIWQPLPTDLRSTHGHRKAHEMPIECYIAAYRSGPAYTGILLEWDRTSGRMTDGGISTYQGGGAE